MEHLFTPWRMAYIRGEKKPVEGCVFCNLIAGNDDNRQIIAYSEHVFVTLNKFPYNNGHLMVIPYEHVQSQESLDNAVLIDLMIYVNRGVQVLRKVYGAAAFNLGANIGSAAGAGIADHYHFHVVPRWAGDSNFMTVVGSTRVIPDTLENSYKELKKGWETLFPLEGKA